MQIHTYTKLYSQSYASSIGSDRWAATEHFTAYLIGETEASLSVPFPTFLQPLSNAFRVFKRDKPRERWRPVGRPPLALSSQLEANGLGFGGAVFDRPLEATVEQRPLQRPTPRRQQVRRLRWCCPRRLRAPFSQAGVRKVAALVALNEVDDT